jgi:TonB family protein
MLLSKETFHRFNRILLLSIIMLSFLLPFIEVTMQKMPEMTVFFLLLEEAMETYETQHLDVLAETPNRFPWNTLIFSVYVSGTLFFLLRHAWSIGRMLCLLRTCRKEEREDGITLYIHQAKVAPFSWMKLMAISEEDLEKHSEAILAHERAHIRNHHSWDLLLAQACVFLQWFNPAAWLLKQELQTIHEYEADEYVIRNGMDASTYLLSMIEKTVGTRLFTIANSFNQSLLAKRVTMLNKSKSRPLARLKYLYVLPISALAIVAFARSEVSNPFMPSNNQLQYLNEMIVTGYVPQKTGQADVDEKIKTGTVKRETTTPMNGIPSYLTGKSEALKFFARNTKYPISALKAKVEGRVLVKFVVERDGSISDIDIYKGVSPDLDAEAIRVLNMMPKWIPDKQKGEKEAETFIMPISFRLESIDTEKEV